MPYEYSIGYARSYITYQMSLTVLRRAKNSQVR